MLTDLTVKAFLEQVASGEPAPGGGSVAALVAALAGSLCEMVARLTMGRKKDPALDNTMEELLERASLLRETLTCDVDRDADSYGAVMAAYRMPKVSEEEKKVRDMAIEKATEQAARVPLSVAEKGVGLMALAEIVARDGNSNAVTDALVAALAARTAVLAAIYNVRINVANLRNGTFKDDMTERAGALEKLALEKERTIMALGRSIMGEQA